MDQNRGNVDLGRRQILKVGGAALAGWGLLGGVRCKVFGAEGARGKLSGKLALQLGLCSAAVYERGGIEKYPDWKETHVELVGEPFRSEEEDLQGFVGRAGETLVVAFRGTVITEKKNWKTNVERRPVLLCEGANCRVHQGFLDAYARIREPLRELMRGAGKVKNFIFTGHSLGGALALLAGEDFQRQLQAKEPGQTSFEELLVCTFGQPRVGDKQLGGEFKGKLFRFVNDFDPVPHVPITGNYAQFGESVWFDHRQKITSKKAMALRLAIEGGALLRELRKLESNESLSDLAVREGKAGGKKLVEAIKNHRLEGPTGYLACLRKHAEGEY
ncbi:MAG: lipase family protein [Planctomycetaceae bacterium]|nr:lipase family protein [Planctomycetaceae bacterium]